MSETNVTAPAAPDVDWQALALSYMNAESKELLRTLARMGNGGWVTRAELERELNYRLMWWRGDETNSILLEVQFTGSEVSAIAASEATP